MPLSVGRSRGKSCEPYPLEAGELNIRSVCHFFLLDPGWLLVLYEADLYRSDADPNDVTRNVRIDGKLYLFRVTSMNVR